MKINGFTLIELLVAISIMAILSSVAVVSYSGITAKARDSQRIKDLETIKQALELYRSDIHNYPTTNSFPLNTKPESLVGIGTTYLQVPKDSDPVGIGTTYLQVPKDSDPAKNYYYLAMPNSPTVCDNLSANNACLNFILCAKKEGTNTVYDLSACSAFDCGGVGVKCNIGISSQ